MGIIDSVTNNEVRRVQLNRVEVRKEVEPDSDSTPANDTKGVVSENNRALSLSLNNKEFSVNLQKVAQLKQDVDSGNYRPDANNIAKEIALGEKRGDFNLGLFNT